MNEVSAPDSPAAEFIYPEMKGGMTVEVAFDRDFTKPMLGWVQKAKPHTIDVLLFRDRIGGQIWPSVRHRDDPFLLEHPEAYKRGVFVLSSSEIDRIETRKTLERLLVVVEQLANNQATLKPAPDVTQDETQSIPAAVHRRVGRPPKHLAEVESAQ